MRNIAQVRRVLNDDEEIGMGFNSESCLAVGSALEGFTIQEDMAAGGQVVLALVSIITSHEELMQTGRPQVIAQFPSAGNLIALDGTLTLPFSKVI